MNKRKRFIALLLCVLFTICVLPLTALAAYAPVGTEDEPSSVPGCMSIIPRRGHGRR